MKGFRDALKRMWRSQEGDTLIETLTAILIAALGATALATMVMASVNMTATTERALHVVYQAESSMREESPGLALGVVTISMPDDGISVSTSVNVYASDNGMFHRYEPQPNANGGQQ